MKKYLSIITGILLFCGTGYSQSAYLSHHMGWLPQSLKNNPAQRPEYKAYFGFPAFSSLYAGYGNGLGLDDVFQQTSDDSLLLDMGYVIGNMKDMNFLDLSVNEELVNVGFTVGKDFLITISATEKFKMRFSYPKSLFEFLWKGNGAFIGETADLGGLGIELIAYSELSAGLSFPFTDKIVLGGNFKYLAGRGHFSAMADKFDVYTDPNDYHIAINSGLDIYTAGADIRIQDEFDVDYETDYFASNNSGFAVDLAGTYILDSNITLSGGVLDLGYIQWKTAARHHYIEDGNYEYTGLELSDLFSDEADGSFDDQLDQIADTLEQIFEIQEENAAYRQMLRSTIFVSGEYKFSRRHKVGALVRGEFFNSRFYPSASVSYHHRFGKILSLSANYTLRNRAYSNLGLGFVFKAGPVQFYMLGDNLLGAFSPGTMRFMNIQTGINFRLGSYDKSRMVLRSPAAKQERRAERQQKREVEKASSPTE